MPEEWNGGSGNLCDTGGLWKLIMKSWSLQWIYKNYSYFPYRSGLHKVTVLFKDWEATFVKKSNDELNSENLPLNPNRHYLPWNEFSAGF